MVKWKDFVSCTKKNAWKRRDGYKDIVEALRYFRGEAFITSIARYTHFTANAAFQHLKELEQKGKVARRNHGTSAETWYLT
jgi:predicted ArsR family transcriptional regulator